jgi:hypothetical protein
VNIGIPLSKNAYTPESYAYYEYLNNRGWDVQLDYELDPDNDINIFFMGLRPFYKKYTGKAKVIHEYQSLSIAPFARLKDTVKRYINEQPDGRIFLNSSVSDVYRFNDKIPFIYRDMGVSDIYFQTPSLNPIYDVVYCGSIANRYGIEKVFLSIAAKGLKLVIIGDASNDFREKFITYKNVIFLGRRDRLEIAEVYRNSRFGLNYTPDIYPFNIQTSTKTLEYLASGLTLISNKYSWIEKFSNSIGNIPIWIDQLGNLDDNFLSHEFKEIDLIKEFNWSNTLDKSRFENFLYKVVHNETNN